MRSRRRRACIGILLAYLFYVAKPGLAAGVGDDVQRSLSSWLYNKYFVDEAYDAMVVEPVVQGSRTVLWRGIDAGVIDGIVNGVGKSLAECRRRIAADAIGQHPQLCGVGSAWIARRDCRDGVRGRRTMNLLDILHRGAADRFSRAAACFRRTTLKRVTFTCVDFWSFSSFR